MVAVPLHSGRAARTTTLRILRRFEFEASLMRSGTVCDDSDGTDNSALLFVRGAPSTIERLIASEKLPSDYRQVRLSCLCLVHGRIDHSCSLAEVKALGLCGES